ncbi:MAG: anthranilate synthase component I [Pseudomonadota bacterium]
MLRAFPSQQEFATLAAAGYNRIPLCRELLSDLDTPLSAYLKTAAGPYSFLLESVQGGEKWGRYSIIGLPAAVRVEIGGERFQVFRDDRCLIDERVSAPLERLRRWWSQFRSAPVAGLPRFSGGLVGYFGYDIVRFVEELPAPPADALEVPDSILLLADELLIFDNLAGRILLVTHVDPGESGAEQAFAAGQARLDHLHRQLLQPLRLPPSRPARQLLEADFVSSFPQAEFEAAVARAQRYILDGDIMQVVLSQRLSAPYAAAPLDLYRALRSLNPSPYMFFLDLERFQVVGASPEVLARLEDGEVTVRPIAGTRPRGRTPAEDQALERELLADPKEIAEHLMLLDLGRNDVGRVAETGSVRVTDQMVIERYSHVMHIVSNVTGRVREGLDAFDVLAATFPAGTVSGAPKVRAMEIIDELEPVKRGVYAGAVGYIGWNGNMDTAIAIRTAVLKDGRIHVQAGAGIVADSVPAKEWEETMNKGRAALRAAQLAAAGLDRSEQA